MMANSNLGRLEQIELRNIWTDEARDFTPWLAQDENLRLLGDTIGITLELESQEKAVGPFSADILCKDIGNDSWVLIENQLERTDHRHLGQLLTYAAGLQTVTLIWIAQRLTDEHRAALDWLNEITDEKFRFFGLEIEVWKIGDSTAAPKFNIVSKPNNWIKDGARSSTRFSRSELTYAQKRQLDFWTEFLSYCDENPTSFYSYNEDQSRARPQSYLNFNVLGRGWCRLAAIASSWDSVKNTMDNNELRTEVYLDGINSKAQYQAIESQRNEIESSLESELTWYSREGVRACRIYTRKEVDLDDRIKWPEYHQWLATNLNDLHRVFGPIIRNIEP